MRMHKGDRIATTVRLPYDEYRECAVRAKARNWSMSDYIGYCVTRELDPSKRKQKSSGKLSEHALMRDFDGGLPGEGSPPVPSVPLLGGDVDD
jgi:hypothetical protein